MDGGRHLEDDRDLRFSKALCLAARSPAQPSPCLLHTLDRGPSCAVGPGTVAPLQRNIPCPHLHICPSPAWLSLTRTVMQIFEPAADT